MDELNKGFEKVDREKAERLCREDIARIDAGRAAGYMIYRGVTPDDEVIARAYVSLCEENVALRAQLKERAP